MGVGMTCASSLAVLAAPQAFAASPVYLILLTISYLISISALVIGWLALPHHIMLQARKALLQPLTDEYEQVLKETLAAITDDTATIEAGSKRLLALQDRYRLLRDTFPVWPLEMMQMRRLVIAFILPVLLSLLDWVTKR